MAKKLFQHIASEKELKGLYEKMRLETLKVMGQGALFNGLVKEYERLTDDTPELPGERKEVVTTVMDRLEWHRASVEAITDYELTRDSGNQLAKADVILDGKTILKDAPVTWLLAAENRFRAGTLVARCADTETAVSGFSGVGLRGPRDARGWRCLDGPQGSVSRVASPPCAGITNTSKLPYRSDANAMRVPS